MALNDTALNLMATQLKTSVTHISLHTADPGATGLNESAAARKAVTWGTVANGDFSMTGTLAFTGGTANGACTYLGLWSASTSGTFYGGYALTGDQTFNSAGEYTVTSLAINGSAS
jgi:hypothetical protein